MSHDYLLIHLKMTGRLYVSKRDEETEADRYLRVNMYLDDQRELRFSDMRKFGRVYLVANLEPVFGHLGPEPLSDEFTQEIFEERLNGRSGLIKPLLLNQTFVAGIGNIYADEALWHARIAPRRKADTLEADEIERLYHSIRRALQDGLDAEGSTISWYRKPDGTTGEYQKQFRAYDREGEPCPRCGTPIVKIRLGQRGTHYCPNCQNDKG
jgi:formamidopyrimidine-DNA glycosylase